VGGGLANMQIQLIGKLVNVWCAGKWGIKRNGIRWCG